MSGWRSAELDPSDGIKLTVRDNNGLEVRLRLHLTRDEAVLSIIDSSGDSRPFIDAVLLSPNEAVLLGGALIEWGRHHDA